jgi:hypothetical protein
VISVRVAIRQSMFEQDIFKIQVSKFMVGNQYSGGPGFVLRIAILT